MSNNIISKKVTKPPISYTARDFASIKQDLVNFVERYYPDTFKDFQEAGFGSMLFDTVAYVGDVLSFYVDYQANESLLTNALERKNVINLSRQLGYKHNPNKAASGIISLYISVPASTSVTFDGGAAPDINYLPTLKQGSTFNTSNGISYILTTDVDFADSANERVVSQTDPSTGLPTFFAVKAFGRVTSGEVQRSSISVGSYTPFRKIQLNLGNLVEVISVLDSQGREYYEVDHLSQDVVYREIPNRGPDSQYAKSLMKPIAVPRRFTVERVNNRTILQFGYGSESDLNSAEQKVTPSRVILDFLGKNYIQDINFDPGILLSTGKFGIAPSNTSLQVKYRINSTNNVNIPTGRLTNITNAVLQFSNRASLSTALTKQVRDSLEITNDAPIVGDTTAATSEEIKVRAIDSFATQSRVVTANDYKALLYQMPPKFGSVKRAAVYRDQNSFKNNINIYTISEDSQKKLLASSSTLKTNIKTYLGRFKSIGDTIDILDASVVNLGFDYIALAEETVNDKLILMHNINKTLREYLKNAVDIGEPFIITNFLNVINEVKGVADVLRFRVKRRSGANYSSIDFDPDFNTSADGRKIYIPKNVIWEIKFPNSDIRGSVR